MKMLFLERRLFRSDNWSKEVCAIICKALTRTKAWDIIQVVAFDSDGSSPFNRIVYRIERGDQDKFIIDADTGNDNKLTNIK